MIESRVCRVEQHCRGSTGKPGRGQSKFHSRVSEGVQDAISKLCHCALENHGKNVSFRSSWINLHVETTRNTLEMAVGEDHVQGQLISPGAYMLQDRDPSLWMDGVDT